MGDLFIDGVDLERDIIESGFRERRRATMIQRLREQEGQGLPVTNTLNRLAERAIRVHEVQPLLYAEAVQWVAGEDSLQVDQTLSNDGPFGAPVVFGDDGQILDPGDELEQIQSALSPFRGTESLTAAQEVSQGGSAFAFEDQVGGAIGQALGRITAGAQQQAAGPQPVAPMGPFTPDQQRVLDNPVYQQGTPVDPRVFGPASTQAGIQEQLAVARQEYMRIHDPLAYAASMVAFEQQLAADIPALSSVQTGNRLESLAAVEAFASGDINRDEFYGMYDRGRRMRAIESARVGMTEPAELVEQLRVFDGDMATSLGMLAQDGLLSTQQAGQLARGARTSGANAVIQSRWEQGIEGEAALTRGVTVEESPFAPLIVAGQLVDSANESSPGYWERAQDLGGLVLTAANAPYQATQASYRSLARAWDAVTPGGQYSGGFSEAFRELGSATPLGLIADPQRTIRRNQQVDLFNVGASTLGMGRPLDETIRGLGVTQEFEEIRYRAERDAYTMDNGRVLTIGRSVADAAEYGHLMPVFDVAADVTGTIANPLTSKFGVDLRELDGYTLLSGLTDATVAVAGPGELVVDDLARLAVNSHRLYIGAEGAEAFLTNTRAGSRLVSNLVEETSAARIYNRLGRKIGTQPDSGRLLAALADATDEDEVLGLLAPALNTGQVGVSRGPINDVMRWGRRGATNFTMSYTPSLNRFLADVPGRSIDLGNSAVALRQAHDWVLSMAPIAKRTLREGHGDFYERHFNNIAHAFAHDSRQVRELRVKKAFNDMAEEAFAGLNVENKLRRGKNPFARAVEIDGKMVKPEFSTQHTRVMDALGFGTNVHERGRFYWVNELGENRAFFTPPTVVDGQVVDGVREGVESVMLAEMTNGYLQAFDYRELRRAIRHPIFENKVTGGTRLLAETFQNKIWKPAKLFTVAWPVRVISENMLRAAAMDGTTSAFQHPIQYLSWMIANPDSRVVSFIDKMAPGQIADRFGRGATNVMGDEFSEFSKAYRAALNGRGRRNMLGDVRSTRGEPVDSARRKVIGREFEPIIPADPKYNDAWAEEFGRVASDEVVQAYVASDTLEEAQERFWTDMGDHRVVIDQQKGEYSRLATDRAQADAYIADVIAARVEKVTGGRADLTQAIRDKSLDGYVLWDFTGGGARVGAGFRDALAARREAVGDRLGPMVGSRAATEQEIASWDRVLDTMFSSLMGNPDNLMVRSPVFRQLYWSNVADNARFLDPDDVEDLIANAVRANIPQKEIDRLRKIAGSDALHRYADDHEMFAEIATLREDLAGEYTHIADEVLGTNTNDLLNETATGFVEDVEAVFRRMDQHFGFQGRNGADLGLDGMFNDVDILTDEFRGIFGDEIAASQLTDMRSIADDMRALMDEVLDQAAQTVRGETSIDEIVRGITGGRTMTDMVSEAVENLKRLRREAYEEALNVARGGPLSDELAARLARDTPPGFRPGQRPTVGRPGGGTEWSGPEGLPRKKMEEQVAYLEKLRRDGKRLSLAELNEIADATALEGVQSVLFDLSKRNQFFDAMNLIIPFGDAWREQFMAWSKLLADSPILLRRGSQAWQAAQEEEFNGFLNDIAPGAGLAAVSGEGFFHENQYGEEVFTFPFGVGLTDSIAGVPVRLEGRTRGLVAINSVIPGIGPAAQIPAEWLLDKIDETNPQFTEWTEGIREILMPFGAPDLSPSALLQLGVPTWSQKLLLGFDADTPFATPQQKKKFAGDFDRVVAYLASTGEYNLGDPELYELEFNRLLEDASGAARDLMGLNAFLTFLGPTSPIMEFLAEDTEGNLVLQAALADEYRRMQDEDFFSASTRFVDTFGTDLLFSAIPTTSTRGFASTMPSTEEALHWLGDNDGDYLRSRFPATFGAWVPAEAAEGDFYYPAYARSIFEEGTREALSPEDFVRSGQALLAQVILNDAYERLSDDEGNLLPDAYNDIQKIEDDLEERYDGFRDDLGMPGFSTQQAVNELQRAAGDRRLAGHSATATLQEYFQLRAGLMSAAQQTLGVDPGEFFRAEDDGLSSYQAQLFDYGVRAVRENRDFRTMWERILVREFELGDQRRFEDELVSLEEAA